MKYPTAGEVDHGKPHPNGTKCLPAGVGNSLEIGFIMLALLGTGGCGAPNDANTGDNGRAGTYGDKGVTGVVDQDRDRTTD